METFLVSFLEHFGPIVLAFVSVIFIFTIKKVAEKYGYKVDVEVKNLTEALLMQIVQNGISYAEQWAKNYVAKTDVKSAGAEKLDIAFRFIVEELKRYNIIDLAEREVKAKIEAMLGVETIMDSNFQKTFPDDFQEGNNEKYTD